MNYGLKSWMITEMPKYEATVISRAPQHTETSFFKIYSFRLLGCFDESKTVYGHLKPEYEYL